MQNLFIGVDGGASKCIVRIENETGELLGRTISGPANIRLSVEKTWESIYSAIINILKPLGIIFEHTSYRFHAGMGLAGCEVASAYQAFLKNSRFFHTLQVHSDAYTACLGAHNGENGAVIISGTGAVGLQIENGKITKVGGFGFPQDDEGSGAWLGLQAVKITLRWLDGRLPPSELARIIYTRFANNQDTFMQWLCHAHSTAYAELAPFVIQLAKAGDASAIKLLKQAARAIDDIGQALLSAQSARDTTLPYALVGTIAPFLEPYLNNNLRAQLRPCKFTPDVGAILLVRRNFSS
ncbi:MAG: hypothetical protein A3F42_01050 [Gammaproteobacteria bacterium RIFCSPHIGHO2_12_FULL_37_34]|nr:MAG: hypothetical protein A3F42_01050 [Gammaproteobacteria bacterium RIFCSPHIGHO2_12_FULL_37_34]